MAPRRKAARIEAPTTIEQATRLVAEYLELGAQVDQTKLDADSSIRAIEEQRDLVVAPAEERMKTIFMQLRTWWTVARDDLTGGKRKSFELAGAILGDRIGNPTLKLPKAFKVEDAVAFLKSIADIWPNARDFIRTKEEVDKPPLLKALGKVTDPGPMIERIREAGFRVEQKEEFFIDRAAPAETDPIVEEAQA